MARWDWKWNIHSMKWQNEEGEIIFLYIKSNWYLKVINIYIFINKTSLETAAVESVFCHILSCFCSDGKQSKPQNKLLFSFPLLAFYCPTKMPWNISWLIHLHKILAAGAAYSGSSAWPNICLFVSCPAFVSKTISLSLLVFQFFSPSRSGWVHFSCFSFLTTL